MTKKRDLNESGTKVIKMIQQDITNLLSLMHNCSEQGTYDDINSPYYHQEEKLQKKLLVLKESLQDISEIQSENVSMQVSILSVKLNLFEMWNRVDLGYDDARSFIGDTALSLRTALYDQDESMFWDEYEAWKKNKKNRR